MLRVAPKGHENVSITCMRAYVLSNQIRLEGVWKSV